MKPGFGLITLRLALTY